MDTQADAHTHTRTHNTRTHIQAHKHTIQAKLRIPDGKYGMVDWSKMGGEYLGSQHGVQHARHGD